VCLNNMDRRFNGLQSYVTQDKIYCIYIAPNEEMVREHASRAGFGEQRIRGEVGH